MERIVGLDGRVDSGHAGQGKHIRAVTDRDAFRISATYVYGATNRESIAALPVVADVPAQEVPRSSNPRLAPTRLWGAARGLLRL